MSKLFKQTKNNKINKDMVKDIIDDTSGDYKNVLVAICQK